MAFFEVEFPRKLSYAMTGGAMFSTSVNMGFSGFEQRNRNWNTARGKWQVMVSSQQNGSGVVTDFDLLRNFHLVVGGMADAFRLFEPTDFSISLAAGTGILTPGTGAQTIFQLTKSYKIAGRTYVRNITKPITTSVKDYQGNALTNTIVVYVNGVAKTLGVDYTLDYTTGKITFTVAPANGAVVAADCQFHWPVRFNSDEFRGTIEESDVKNNKALVSVAVDLMEIRL
jgi:uncharacterized protein (TIGR02217 family)